MSLHSMLDVSVLPSPHSDKSVALSFVVKDEEGKHHPVSPIVFLNREEAKYLARVINEVADMVPREMVEGDL